MSGRGYLVPAPPLTGACAACKKRVKVRKDGTLWRHRPASPKAISECPGSGTVPPSPTVKRKWPAGVKRSVQPVSGGAFESDRRRH